jgi:hypothetical protein
MAEDWRRRMTASANEAYERWLYSPTVKLMVSMIPPASPPETLQTLLREAYEFGMHMGRTQIASEILDNMMKDKKP